MTITFKTAKQATEVSFHKDNVDDVIMVLPTPVIGLDTRKYTYEDHHDHVDTLSIGLAWFMFHIHVNFEVSRTHKHEGK